MNALTPGAIPRRKKKRMSYVNRVLRTRALFGGCQSSEQITGPGVPLSATCSQPGVPLATQPAQRNRRNARKGKGQNTPLA